MDYKVVVTKDAEEDLDSFISYLITKKESIQAARNLLDDFDATIECLRHIAGSLKMCSNQKLKKAGYRRINFLNHRYFLLYRIENDLAIVDNVFHELQDFENKLH